MCQLTHFKCHLTHFKCHCVSFDSLQVCHLTHLNSKRGHQADKSKTHLRESFDPEKFCVSPEKRVCLSSEL